MYCLGPTQRKFLLRDWHLGRVDFIQQTYQLKDFYIKTFITINSILFNLNFRLV